MKILGVSFARWGTLKRGWKGPLDGVGWLVSSVYERRCLRSPEGDRCSWVNVPGGV